MTTDSNSSTPLIERLRSAEAVMKVLPHLLAPDVRLSMHPADMAAAIDEAASALKQAPPPAGRIADDLADIKATLADLAAALPKPASMVAASMGPLEVRPGMTRDDLADEVDHLRRKLVASEGWRCREALNDLALRAGLRDFGKLDDQALIAAIAQVLPDRRPRGLGGCGGTQEGEADSLRRALAARTAQGVEAHNALLATGWDGTGDPMA